MNIAQRRGLAFAAVALGVVPLVCASPAFAAPHSVSLTAGPVSLPSVPVSACIDTTCVTTPALTSVTVKATVTTSSSTKPVTLTTASCQNGGKGAAILVSASQTTSVTISASVTGTGPNGPVNVPVGPKTQTISAGTPGVLVSACTS